MIAPVVDCTAYQRSQVAPVQQWACVLLLHPIEKAIGREDKDRGDYFLDAGGKARHRGGEPAAPNLFASVSICDSRLFRTAPEGPFSLLRLWNRAQAAGHLYGLVHDADEVFAYMKAKVAGRKAKRPKTVRL